jgi:NhaA family Na+:H+ antiporter
MFTADDFARIASDFGLPPLDGENAIVPARVQEDVGSAQRSGVIITPTFFINGRRYEGPWDENTLAEAMLGTLGHRLHAATLNFARWAPAAGLLLLLMSVLAVVLGNSPLGPAFESLWQAPFGFQLFSRTFILPLLDWVNHGMLSIFFLVVGLEIKREFTVGHLLRARGRALDLPS